MGKEEEERTFEELLGRLDTKHDLNTRRRSIYELGKLGNKRAIQPLHRILQEETDSGWIRKATLEALGNLDDPSLIDVVTPLLEHKDNKVRADVVVTISRFWGEGIIDLLLQSLEDKCADVREIACSGLMKLKSKEAYEPILELLNDDSANVRFRAVEAVFNIDGKKSLEKIAKMLEDESPQVVILAASYLTSEEDERGSIDSFIRDSFCRGKESTIL